MSADVPGWAVQGADGEDDQEGDDRGVEGGDRPLPAMVGRVEPVDAGDVEEWRIRGYWYLDKRQGELRYRLLGLCPVANEARSKAYPDDGVDAKVELFWVWFPATREVLNQSMAFNRKNTSQPISFDHLLNSRRFSAVIYREDNVQGDRGVADYISDNALMQLLESDRIKEQIRNIEIDLWNY